MAGRALRPLSLMSSSEYREKLRVVVNKLTAHACGVTEEAILAVIVVPRYPFVYRICLTLEMTDQTVKHLAISRDDMTGITVCPLPQVSAGKYREELRVMIQELSLYPGGMTEIAIL